VDGVDDPSHEGINWRVNSMGYAPTLWELLDPVVWVELFLSSALVHFIPSYGTEWNMDRTLAEKNY